jgi:hypothetical protein
MPCKDRTRKINRNMSKDPNCPLSSRYGDTSPQVVSNIYVDRFETIVPDIAGRYNCRCKRCEKVFSVYEDLTVTPSKYQWPENCIK